MRIQAGYFQTDTLKKRALYRFLSKQTLMFKKIYQISLSVTCVILSFFSSVQAQDLIFHSGFEGDVRAFPTSSPEFLEGSDNLSASPNDWTRNLDNHPEIGTHSFQYEGENHNRRQVKIVSDPEEKKNKSLLFNILDREKSDRVRIQMNIYRNRGLREFTQAVDMYLDPDLEIIKEYPDKYTWFTIFELWNNILHEGKYPFRIAINLQKLYKGPNDALFFRVYGQVNRNGKWESVWEQTNDVVEVPIGQWVTTEVYFKEGNERNGIFEFSITNENGDKTQVFSINHFTHHPQDPKPKGVQRFNPIKLYTFDKLTSFAKNNGKSLKVYWDDFFLWKGDARIKYQISNTRSVEVPVQRKTLKAVADSYTHGSKQTLNYGNKNIIEIRKKGAENEAFLKFNVGKYSYVKNATLRLYGRNPNNEKKVRVRVFGTTDAWDESRINFQNSPPTQGNMLDQQSIDDSQQYYEWDVTQYVRKQTQLDGKISFILASRETNSLLARFQASEAGKNVPQLVIQGTPVHLGPQKQFIQFEPISDILASSQTIYLQAEATSRLPVYFKVLSGPASITNNKLKMTGSSGMIEVIALQNGNNKFLAADPIVRRFRVVKPKGEQMFIRASADAQVVNGNSNQNHNYGRKEFMEVRNKSSYGSESYIKFNLEDVQDITSARLRLYGENPKGSSPVKIAAYSVSDGWSEKQITYKNRPKVKGRIRGITMKSEQKYYEIEVTDYVKQELKKDKNASFVIISENQNLERVRIQTRESRYYAPELRVVGTPKLNAPIGPQGKINSAEADSTESEPQASETLKMKVFPNPFHDKFQVMLTGADTQTFLIRLLNLQGQEVFRTEDVFPFTEIVLRDNVPTGIYILDVSDGTRSLGYKKLIKQ